MIVRALDGNEDWQFGKGRNDYLSANSAVAQSIMTRLKSFLNDCFFSKESGIDWITFLGGKDQRDLNIAISTTILNTPNVTGINQLSANLDSTRRFTVSYQVQTTFSNVNDTFTFDIGTGG